MSDNGSEYNRRDWVVCYTAGVAANGPCCVYCDQFLGCQCRDIQPLDVVHHPRVSAVELHLSRNVTSAKSSYAAVEISGKTIIVRYRELFHFARVFFTLEDWDERVRRVSDGGLHG